MSRAYCLVRDAPWYRRQAFVEGLKRAGFEIQPGVPDPGRTRPGDVLVIWNRYGGNHQIATRFENGGGTVIVAENGYISPKGTAPKFDVHTKEGPKPTDYYALSKTGHNGSGWWPVGGPERFDALGLELKPWQENPNGHILVCGQRGIGSPTMASPPGWNEATAASIRKRTKREVRIRPHPGNDAPKRPLELDLAGAWACAIWSSGSGIKALALGIPTFFDAPFWICSPGALRMSEDPEKPLRSDAARLVAMQRMAWAQWQVQEIQSGEPFRRLLQL